MIETLDHGGTRQHHTSRRSRNTQPMIGMLGAEDGLPYPRRHVAQLKQPQIVKA